MAKTKVLVIEDDKSVRTSIRLTLQSHGFDVDEADNGAKGIWMLKHTPFDLAIIDMMMPVMDGLETIRELKSLLPKLGILAISGGSTVVNVDFLKAAAVTGATATLSKPFEGGQLITALQKITTRAA